MLGRQYTLLADLGAPQDLVSVTCEWSDDPYPFGQGPELKRVAPGAYWRIVLGDETEALEFRTCTHLYAGTLTNLPATLDPFVRAVADLETAGRPRAQGLSMACPSL
ncbi:hypothetical protein ACFXCZ_24425 [Streptomyces sp. NPDC059396]|uniref:hypothetical protein n=1 Tax=Streptomyces sp. NPDC059396 TaxID=3346819 RepID=UPI003678D506